MKILNAVKPVDWKCSGYCVAVLCFGALFFLGTPAFADPTSDSAKTLEYRIKAAFLYNFARFVEWPQQNARNGSKLVIGILGEDPFGPLLDETVRGKNAAGRPLEIKRLSSVDNAASCHLVFVSSSQRRHLEKLLAALNGAKVLTVGETPSFLDNGGMINFVIEDERVQIDLNLSTTQAAGLSISYQLIRVARKVHEN